MAPIFKLIGLSCYSNYMHGDGDDVYALAVCYKIRIGTYDGDDDDDPDYDYLPAECTEWDGDDHDVPHYDYAPAACTEWDGDETTTTILTMILHQQHDSDADHRGPWLLGYYNYYFRIKLPVHCYDQMTWLQPVTAVVFFMSMTRDSSMRGSSLVLAQPSCIIHTPHVNALRMYEFYMHIYELMHRHLLLPPALPLYISPYVTLQTQSLHTHPF
ncbi:hypothetical protein GBA52_022561 [Prunus armeniaca]|nr:hypothetical protein GBA52_022561 [Prunus armeniaca]